MDPTLAANPAEIPEKVLKVTGRTALAPAEALVKATAVATDHRKTTRADRVVTVGRAVMALKTRLPELTATILPTDPQAAEQPLLLGAAGERERLGAQRRLLGVAEVFVYFVFLGAVDVTEHALATQAIFLFLTASILFLL